MFGVQGSCIILKRLLDMIYHDIILMILYDITLFLRPGERRRQYHSEKGVRDWDFPLNQAYSCKIV